MGSERVADRLALAAAAALVGRERERHRLRAWVIDPDGPSAVFVHGPAGIGKTALVAGTLVGPTTVLVEGRGGGADASDRARPRRLRCSGWQPPHRRSRR